MDTCFVIQPFDKDKFDRRYIDIFEPAIKSADLDPYRVDRDPSVRIPIDQIEEGIKKARICFAEITTDNPNVWYELGFAFAREKDVVMICSEERLNQKFPFDIQHRHIISYKTGSTSDYKDLEKGITEKLKAFLQRREKVQSIINNPVKESEGLKQHELTLLLMVLENQLTEDESVGAYMLQNDMEKAGFTKAATNIAIRELKAKGLLTIFKEESNYNEEPYPAVRLTTDGESWVLNNQDKIEFRKPKANQEFPKLRIIENDLPF